MVDDQPEVLADLEATLTAHFPGLQVRTTTDVGRALEILGHGCCDIIISDYRMRTTTNGVEFLQRAAAVCPKAARIAMAGDPDQYLVEQGSLHGFTVLGKPIQVPLLLQLVGHYIRMPPRLPKAGN